MTYNQRAAARGRPGNDHDQRPASLKSLKYRSGDRLPDVAHAAHFHGLHGPRGCRLLFIPPVLYHTPVGKVKILILVFRGQDPTYFFDADSE